MDPYLHLILNDYAYWDRENSFAQAASTDVVSALGDPGLGALAFVTADSGLYFGGGLVDADANGKYPDFDSLGRGRFVYTAEAGWVGKVSGRSGDLRINYANAPEKPGFEGGESWSLTASHDVSRRVVLWVRAAYAPRPSQDFRGQVAAGVVIKSPFGFASDRLFLSGAWTRPKDSSLRDETLLEASWRLQLTARLRLTPSLQMYLNPARDPTRSVVFVAGLRLFLRF